MTKKLRNLKNSLIIFAATVASFFNASAQVPVKPLSSFLTPPPGATVLVSGGDYFWKSGGLSLTPVPVAVLASAKNAQLGALQAQLIGSGYSAAAAAVYFGIMTPEAAGLIPFPGALVTVNGSGEVLSWQPQLPYGNSGYVPVRADAPESQNLPVVGTSTNAAGQLVSTGQVIRDGGGPAPVIPVEPDTPTAVPAVPAPTVYVGAAIGWTPPVGALPAYSTWDNVPDGTYVEWSNTAHNGAPAGFYLKHQTSKAGPFGNYVTRWYEAVDGSKVPPGGVLQAGDILITGEVLRADAPLPKCLPCGKKPKGADDAGVLVGDLIGGGAGTPIAIRPNTYNLNHELTRQHDSFEDAVERWKQNSPPLPQSTYTNNTVFTITSHKPSVTITVTITVTTN